ncbi:alanine racemase [Microbacterium sp. ISL-59]|uniref:alanine racemase n=1 Tax=Microbacterium sp. ISL-59 TaxID=2819159 RepID=UPI001BEAA9D8|nr:alanine racemase [Microbacterium sp. ISL-59]MBT2493991.1 alanine racemase [Microbacterium sp. ISL-59]
MSRPELRISSSVFRTNIEAVRTRIAPSALMLVLKDDAYGHGLAWAVETAVQAGVDRFGSYDITGGLSVRRVAGGDARIFAWATSTDAEVDDALLQQIDLGVGTTDYLRRIITRADALGVRARVHLKIDTGLHRNGILPEDWAATVADARAAERAGLLELDGVWSHIAEASDEEDDDAQAVFLDAVRVVGESGPVPASLHLTASAASWWRPEMRGTVSRIGAFCYGIRSADGPELPGVRPVASLVATVVDVVDGDAVISIGSFDGFPSTLRGVDVGTPDGARNLTAVGQTTSVVAGWPGLRVGDEVTLFGAGDRGESSATTLAERIDTVGEEILTRLTARVRRVVRD